MMYNCDSWHMVWRMQVETCQALVSRLALYWPGVRAQRAVAQEEAFQQMLDAIRRSESHMPVSVPVTPKRKRGLSGKRMRRGASAGSEGVGNGAMR